MGASTVQLNRADCLWKVGEDLLHLFEYHPTPSLSLPVKSLEALYCQCYSRKLLPAVYAAKDIHQLLRAKILKKVIQVRFVLWVNSFLKKVVEGKINARVSLWGVMVSFSAVVLFNAH